MLLHYTRRWNEFPDAFIAKLSFAVAAPAIQSVIQGNNKNMVAALMEMSYIVHDFYRLIGHLLLSITQEQSSSTGPKAVVPLEKKETQECMRLERFHVIHHFYQVILN